MGTHLDMPKYFWSRSMPYGLVWANRDQSSLVVESCAFAVLAEVAGEDTELVTELMDIVRAFGEPGAALNYK